MNSKNEHFNNEIKEDSNLSDAIYIANEEESKQENGDFEFKCCTTP